MGRRWDRRPELLSPAGDWDSLRAAAGNGADAVYFGLDDFNARRRAANFTLAELPKVMDCLHAHNVRGYVALNTLVFPEELARAAAYAAKIAECGADAVIVQDLGLARLVARQSPDLPIHASTQMTLNDVRGIEWVKRLGVRRVVLARELSVGQIAEIARATDVELEVFIHGALCISYSGQCAASQCLFERSGNRGRCAQACRLPYELIVDGKPHPTPGPYLLSPRDLAGWGHVRELTGAGVAAFKIEGRLKGAHYVAAATAVYRAAIDAAVTGKAFKPSARQMQELAQSFSRGFSAGHLGGSDHAGLIENRFPRARGVRVGTVSGRSAGGVVVELVAGESLKNGDGVVFDDGRPQRHEQGGRIFEVRPVPGGAGRGVELAFGRGDVDLSAVAAGGDVWRTDDPAVRRRLGQSFGRDVVVRPAAISARVSAAPGEALRVAFRDEAGNEVEVASDRPLAAARRHPLTVELLRKQLGRLGGTPLVLAGVGLIGPGGPCESAPVMAPVSLLNDLRRRAVELLLAQRAVAARRAVVEPKALEALRRGVRGIAAGAADGPRLHVLLRRREQLAALADFHAARPDVLGVVYLDLSDPGDWAAAMADGRRAGLATGLATTRVTQPGRDELLERIAELAPPAVLVRNLSAAAFLRDRRPWLLLVGDWSLNAANELTAGLLAEASLARITPAYELGLAEIRALLECLAGSRLEVLCFQHVPMFYTEHCLYAANVVGVPKRDDSRLGSPEACARRVCAGLCRRRRVELRDRNGVAHPVWTDAACRNVVFHARPVSGERSVRELLAAGVRHFRVELLGEGPPQVAAILHGFGRAIG